MISTLSHSSRPTLLGKNISSILREMVGFTLITERILGAEAEQIVDGGLGRTPQEASVQSQFCKATWLLGVKQTETLKMMPDVSPDVVPLCLDMVLRVDSVT